MLLGLVVVKAITPLKITEFPGVGENLPNSEYLNRMTMDKK